MKLTLLTGNKDKIREAESILGFLPETYEFDLEEIQSLNPKEVVEHKVKQAYSMLKKPVFVWDVSLEFSALNSFPGPLIKFFWKSVSLEKICEIITHLGDNRVIARTTLAYFDGSKTHFFEGITQGFVPENPRGDKGWAFDPIFIPEGSVKTFGEMELDEKNVFSMHRKALKQLKEFLDTNGLVDQR